MAKKEETTHWVLGGALLLIGLFVIIALVLVRSEALEPTVDVTVDNEAPSINFIGVGICDDDTLDGSSTALSDCIFNDDISDTGNGEGLVLTAGASERFHIAFEASDSNGVDDLSATAEAVFYHDSVTENCSENANNCYTGLTCTKATDDPGDTFTYYACPLDVEYYANPTVGSTDWNTWTRVTDSSGASGTDTQTDENVSELVSATFPDVNFGQLALGFTSSAGDNEEISHQNNGNVNTDFHVVADTSDLTCDLGSFSVNNISFDSSDVGFASATYTLATSSMPTFDLNLAQRLHGESTSTKTSFWNIDIPDSGVDGSCIATMTATAQAG